MSKTLVQQAWFLTGPTAGGKTRVGVELARRIGAEIVSVDSMAVYREMDIGTAKPTAEEQAEIPHHLIDFVPPDRPYSLAQYVEAAEGVADAIAGRGKEILFVGGTPLYLKGLLRGIFEGPKADPAFRAKLEEQTAQHGGAWLHRQLTERDPTSAERLHPNDTRRIIRALEVFKKTGRPISDWQKQFDLGLEAEACRVFVLDWERETIYRRIETRVDQMFGAGLVDEVRRLLERTPPISGTAAQGVGYREVIDHLQGKTDLEEAIELVKRNTRRLAKKQGTWFRSLSECRFVPVQEPIDPVEVAERILAMAKSTENRAKDQAKDRS